MDIKQFRKEVERLIQFFDKDYDYPATIKLSQCETITDARLFVQSHVDSIKKHSEDKYFKSELDRLIWLRNYVKENKIKSIGERKLYEIIKEEKPKTVPLDSVKGKQVESKNIQVGNNSPTNAGTQNRLHIPQRDSGVIEIAEAKKRKIKANTTPDAPTLF